MLNEAAPVSPGEAARYALAKERGIPSEAIQAAGEGEGGFYFNVPMKNGAPGQTTTLVVPKSEIGTGAPDLEKLHNIQTEIGDMLSRAKVDNSIGKDTRRLLMGVKEKLKGQMEADNPAYAQAQRTFRDLSKPLNDFRFGNPDIKPKDPHIKTMLAQLADLGDEAFEKAPGIVFSGNSPGKIARTKTSFEKHYPNARDSLTRSYREEKLNKIKDTVAQREGNVGGAFKRSVFNGCSIFRI
jgi:hypothetical protein